MLRFAGLVEIGNVRDHDLLRAASPLAPNQLEVLHLHHGDPIRPRRFPGRQASLHVEGHAHRSRAVATVGAKWVTEELSAIGLRENFVRTNSTFVCPFRSASTFPDGPSPHEGPKESGANENASCDCLRGRAATRSGVVSPPIRNSFATPLRA